MTDQTSLDEIRRRLGDRYAIERELGRGGMGAVYLARDLRLDRPVALKVLPPEFAGDATLRERFLRETRTAASFSHPNIVPVHAVEERDGLLAFAMGYVEGESLAQRVHRAGPLDARGIVRLLQDIGYALAYAHGRGVVHRDIKPDNVMLERATGRAQLMDFGISRPITAAVGTQGMTRVGEVVGTPEYMSPEQASGDSVDGRSDLYSLGLVALYALTGRPQITGETTQQILVKQLTEMPPRAVELRGDIPAALGDAIDRCVAKKPEDRFASAEALVEAIDVAQLAGAEIPVPIRMFAQEAGTLGLVLVFLTLTSWLTVRTMRKEVGTAYALLPAIILIVIALTRALLVSSAARRLAVLGFQPGDVSSGLRAVVDERENLRQQLRADPDTRRRRRRTVLIAVLLLPVAIVLVGTSLNVRFSLGTGAGITRSGDPQSGEGGSLGRFVMSASGLSLLGVSFLLLVRGPFRMPIGERLFRLVWLGPIGRAFLQVSTRGVGRRPGGVGRAASGATRAAPVQPGGDRIAALESRVKALEQWRAGRER